jgi:two-component system sensor histidine kinase YesM
MKENQLATIRKKLNTTSEDIKNKGHSDDEEKLGTNGIALVNTNTRLKLLYGQDYGLSIESEPGRGTTVTIRLKDA